MQITKPHRIQHTYTQSIAAPPEREKALSEFTDSWYKNMMTKWEKAVNYYLEHGVMIPTNSPT